MPGTRTVAVADRSTSSALAWERVPTWQERILPSRSWGLAYVWGIVGLLLLLAAIFVVNVFVPLGATLGRAAATTAILVLAWGLGLLVPHMLHVPALRPAAFLSVPVIPAIVVGSVAVAWGAPGGFGRFALACAILLACVFLASIPYGRIVQGLDLVPAALGAAALVATGGTLALAVLGVPFSTDTLASAGRGGIVRLLASLVLLIRTRWQRMPVWLFWGGFAQLALVLALHPWVSAGRSGRMLAAGLVLFAALGFSALILALVQPRRSGT